MDVSVRSAFEAALICVILSGGASLALAEGNPIIFLLLAAAALHQATRGWRPLLSRQGVNLAALVVLIVALFDYTFITRMDLLLVLGHIVVGMQVVRIYQGWRDVGIRRILLLGFMQIVVAGAVTAHSIFLAPFVAFVVSSVCVLSLYRLEADGKGETPRVGAGLLMRTAYPSLLVLGASALIFFSFPRLGAGWIGHSRGRGLSMVGFGNSVRLDDIGDLLDNPEVVMRVVSDPVPGSATLWRGRVFDRYTGTEWQPLLDPFATVKVRGRRSTFDLELVNRKPRKAGGSVTQTFFLEAVEPKVIFAALDPVSIRFLTPPPEAIEIDGGRSITSVKPRRREIRYQATSLLPTHEGASRVTWEEIHKTREEWWDLNGKAVKVTRIRDLAQRVAAERGAEGPYEQVLAIEGYLRDWGGFGYTTRIRSREDREPIEDFLFERKEGHCEYFASAMVVMCRSLEIPARLVNGFRGGERHPFGGFYLVRQRHAHAWVEVYLGDAIGWLPMDPTPAIPVPNLASAFRSIEDLIGYLKYQWVTRVVTYNAQDQAGALKWGKASLDRLKNWYHGLVPPLVLGIPTGGLWLILLGALPALRLWRAAARRLRRSKEAAIAVPFYRDLVRLLSRKGFRRGRGETPLEFARRVSLEGGDLWRSVLPVTDAYYQVRFGGAPLTTDETAEIREAIARLRGLRP